MSIFDDLLATLGSDLVERDVPGAYLRDWHNAPPAGTRALALVRPRTTAQVAAVLRLCNAAHVPVVPQGGRTGLAGGATAIDGAVLLSLERMRAIEEVDPVAATVTVEAGVPLQTVQEAAEKAGLFYPLDLGARGSALIGGNLATNAGGNRVLRYGMARASVLGLEVVLADGTVVASLGKMLKNNAGYDLKQLFVGSEGTLGIITRAVLRLSPQPRSTATALCAAPSFTAVEALLSRVRSQLGAELSAFEVMWPSFYGHALAAWGGRPPLPTGHAAYVLVEAMGTDPDRDAERFERVIGAALDGGEIVDAVVARNEAETACFWAIRDMSGELTPRLSPLAAFDVSVETGRIASFVREVGDRVRARWPHGQIVAFGHLADSNVHLIVHGLGEDPMPVHAVDETVYACVRDYGGSISAEHGIGLLKKPFLGQSRTPEEIALMRTLKHALDPNNILNPGKIFDA